MKRAAARKEPKQDRARVTVDALLDATAQVLVEEGYDGASTNRIATRAGVSVGSLYQYFDSKDQLVSAVADRHHQQLMAVLALAAVDADDKSLDDMVRGIIKAMLEAHAVDPALHRVISEQIPHSVMMRHLQEESATFVRALIEKHRDKVRADLDIDVATFLLVHAVEGVTHASVIERPGTLRSKVLTTELARMVTRYLT